MKLTLFEGNGSRNFQISSDQIGDIYINKDNKYLGVIKQDATNIKNVIVCLKDFITIVSKDDAYLRLYKRYGYFETCWIVK